MSKFFDYGFDNIKPSIELAQPIVKEHDGVLVVRDDLLDGGTKRRAFNYYIESVTADEFVYASPREGYAQLSLAYVCKDLGKKATVFVPKGERHWLTNKSEELGAKIIEVPMGYLNVIQSASKQYVGKTKGSHLIPFGGDHPIIIEAMKNTALSLDIEPPKEVWTVMSSGVLSRGLQLAWPDAKIYAVQIGHNTTDREKGRAETMRSDYKFNQECKKIDRPPFPSSLTYDSKAWEFIKQHASEGALFWNVGK
jgi:hypothetical protein